MSYLQNYLDLITERGNVELGASISKIAAEFSKDECFFIGDSGVDILTGKNAGMKTIGAAWGFCGEDVLKEAKADFIAETPKDILDFVLKQ